MKEGLIMPKKMSLIMFSGEYDKAMAALILANTAREMDVEGTVFCTFWGLFMLREPEKMTIDDKTTFEKMFDLLTPKQVEDLPLSKMNAAGLGKKLMAHMMVDDDAPPLNNHFC
jgi:peroxiredoxin family protein